MRNIVRFNESWAFLKSVSEVPSSMPENTAVISLPHTWNAIDGNDGNGSYDRGRYWYARKFTTTYIRDFDLNYYL